MFRFGEGRAGAPKIYMHAALHADETPGMLILHHLLPRLQAAAEAGQIPGEVVVLPQANPLGGAQVLFRDKHVGRFHLPNGENHNRGWELLTEDVVETIGAGLGPDAPANVALIRRVVGEALAAREPVTVLDRYRKAILGLCYDADMVWDLHCDDDSGRHLFIIPEQWPDWQDIAAASRSMVALTAADSGGGSFDECLSTVWTRLQARFPEHPIPLACPSATFEYAGWADVEDSVAAEDAQHLFSILCSRGFVDAEPTPLPAGSRGPAAGGDGNAADQQAGDHRLPRQHRRAGRRGQHVADVVDPTVLDPTEARTPVIAGTDGFVLSRLMQKLVFPGNCVMKIVGREILAERKGGYLLQD